TAPRPPTSTLFPYTTLFRSQAADSAGPSEESRQQQLRHLQDDGGGISRDLRAGLRDLSPRQRRRSAQRQRAAADLLPASLRGQRSEEHTSELQSRENLVCRL